MSHDKSRDDHTNLENGENCQEEVLLPGGNIERQMKEYLSSPVHYELMHTNRNTVPPEESTVQFHRRAFFLVFCVLEDNTDEEDFESVEWVRDILR